MGPLSPVGSRNWLNTPSIVPTVIEICGLAATPADLSRISWQGMVHSAAANRMHALTRCIPRLGALAGIVDIEQGQVHHEPVGRGAVPMESLRFEENAVARTDFFHWTALALATSDSFEYTDGLPMAQNFQSIAA